MSSKEIFFIPKDEFVVDNLYSLMMPGGYATNRREIQRLLIDQINQSQMDFIKVELEYMEGLLSPDLVDSAI